MDDPLSTHTRKDTPEPVSGPRTLFEWIRALYPTVLAVLFSIGVIVLVTYFREQIEALREYGYLGVFFIGFLANATVILPAPGLAFTTALGGVLNPLLVGVAAGGGEALGEMVGYLAGLTGKRIVQNRHRYEATRTYIERYGAWIFFVLAVIPNPFFDMAGIAAGMVRFPLTKFLLSAWAGKTLKAVLFAGVGQQLL